SRNSGTSPVPPASATAPLPSAAGAALDARRYFGLLGISVLPILGSVVLGSVVLGSVVERVEDLGPVDRQRTYVRAGGIPDRVGDRRGNRDDRWLAETLRCEVGEVRVGPVDELGDDLRYVGDGRHPVGVERLCQHPTTGRVEQPLL